MSSFINRKNERKCIEIAQIYFKEGRDRYNKISKDNIY